MIWVHYTDSFFDDHLRLVKLSERHAFLFEHQIDNRSHPSQDNSYVKFTRWEVLLTETAYMEYKLRFG